MIFVIRENAKDYTIVELEKWELTENLLAKKKKATYGKVAFGILVGERIRHPIKSGLRWPIFVIVTLIGAFSADWGLD